MELNKIENLLDAYFEGNTNLEEEALLKKYFSEEEVAPHLKNYKSLFKSFVVAKDEVITSEIKLPKKTNTIKPWMYSVAALLVIAITVASFMFLQPSKNEREKEALAALKQTKEIMMLLSNNLNKGTKELAIIDQFKINKNRILK